MIYINTTCTVYIQNITSNRKVKSKLENEKKNEKRTGRRKRMRKREEQDGGKKRVERER